jgi:hypothetical protein
VAPDQSSRARANERLKDQVVNKAHSTKPALADGQPKVALFVDRSAHDMWNVRDRPFATATTNSARPKRTDAPM